MTPPTEAPGAEELTEAEVGRVVTGPGSEGAGSCCWVGKELQFGGMTKFWRRAVVRVAQHCQCT